MSKRGSKFNDVMNIFEQLPFFCCNDSLIDEESQKDISRYVYSKDTSTPPYKGAYGEQPNTWINKYYIIKNAINLKKQQMELKMRNQNGNK